MKSWRATIDPEEVDLERRRSHRSCRGLAGRARPTSDAVTGEDIHDGLSLPTGYAGWMKIASRPTTIASTPRPSANAARMIARPRIWPAASGLRPIALARHAGEDADADAGADDARGRRGRRRGIPWCVTSSFCPGASPGDVWCLVWTSVGRRRFDRRRRWASTVASCDSSCSSLVTARSRARVNMSVRVLKMSAWMRLSMTSSAEQRHGDDGDGQRGDDAQRDLAAVDVAEESHRQRDRLDELQQELHQADEQRDDPGPDALPELPEREELAEVAADPEVLKPWYSKKTKRDEREADRDVHVAGRGAELVHAADAAGSGRSSSRTG